MKNRRTWLTTLAGAVVACAGQTEAALTIASQSVDGVEFTVDLWPGEGIPVIEARRATLPLHAEPDPESPVVDTVRAPVGRRLVFDATRFQTIKPGTIRSLAPMQVTGRDMGSTRHVSHDQYYLPTTPDVSVPLAAAATIDYLQYRAEGTCFVRIEQRVIDAHPCPGFGAESVIVERQPLTRWWIRVQGESGAVGWILVSDSTAQSVRREF